MRVSAGVDRCQPGDGIARQQAGGLVVGKGSCHQLIVLWAGFAVAVVREDR
jgi:hypothetical protein